MALVKAGDLAPDLELPEASERIVRLSDEVRKGTTVLVFYPTDWGVICTLEMKAFQEIAEDIEMAGAHLLGISVNSTTSHRSWKEQMDIKWALLSDFGGRIASLFGILTPDGRFLAGHAERSVFVIDADRRVRYAWTAPDPSIQPDYGAVLAACRSCNRPRW
jgi:glutaredoxin-dependent peroxiredoxin